MQRVRVTEMRAGAQQEGVISHLDQSHVLQEEQQLPWSLVVRGLVCNVVLETGMWFWFEALALFRPSNLIIQMMWT